MTMNDLTSYGTRAFRNDQIRTWLPAPEVRKDFSVAQRGGGAISPLRLDGRRILIVEDEALLALDLQFACEDDGAEVIGPALSLDQALAKLESNPVIDGAILDVDLCGRDVYPVAVLLRDRGVPFIFHTGHGSRTRLGELFPGSVTCNKPSSPDALIDSLVQLMA
jgi:CheY-like chemotaxis protein